MARNAAPLRHFGAVWFVPPLALAALAHAWSVAVPGFGEIAGNVALVLGALAALAWLAVTAAWLLRWQRHPQECLAEWQHPWRVAFFSALPMAVLVLCALAVQRLDANAWPVVLVWALAAAAQFAMPVQLFRRWLSAPAARPIGWNAEMPHWLLAAAGQMLAPWGGVALVGPEWPAAQWAVGVLGWVLVLALLLARTVVHGAPADRHAASWFITVAPPSVAGVGWLALGGSPLAGWGFWGIALLFLLVAGGKWRTLRTQPFAVGHWAAGFPLAVFAGLSLELAGAGGGMALQVAALVLALASLVIAALLLATWRGLRDGSLLAPEPVAMIESR